MTRMADGLFVLESSIKELLVNFRECLQRLIDAGLTLKPSKVEINFVRLDSKWHGLVTTSTHHLSTGQSTPT